MADTSTSTTILQEVWLRGPLEGFDPIVMPAAHALLQSAEDLERAASPLTRDELWARPGGAASVGFHLQHIAGTIDRLLTYARGEQLDAAQLAALRAEKDHSPHADADELIAVAVRAIQRAVETLRDTRRDSLFEKRGVGRKQ